MPGIKRARSGVRATRTKKVKGMRLSKVPAQVHQFVRHFSSAAHTSLITGNAAHNPLSFVKEYNFGQVVNSSEFQALYDQYRLDWVETKFWLRIDPGAQAQNTANYPKLYTCVDRDSADVLTLESIRERSNCRIDVLRCDRPVVIKFKPSCLMTVYRDATTTSVAPKYGVWLDMASPAVRHMGLSYLIDDLTNLNYKVDIEVKCWFSCKNSR